MIRHWRTWVLVLAACGCAWAGWRVLGQLQAERYASTDPVRALRWRADDPHALLALAEQQLDNGRLDDAKATARRLLAREPLQGEAFRVLAEASERSGDPAGALRLYRIAAKRAPRDQAARMWLARHALQQGDHREALVQIDALLRVSPRRAGALYPALVQLAQDPAFAEALAQALARDPPWRAGLMARLRDPRRGNPRAAGLVMQALQARGALAEDDYARWLDSLMAQGRWGEAYARWAGRAVKIDGRLPPLYNGDFVLEPSNAGFDWRIRRVPGVLLQFEPVAGQPGQAAYFQFLGRRIPSAGLEQPLLLGPGRYRLDFQVRAQALRSEMGLEWQLVCAGSARVIASSDAIDGNLAWRRMAMDVVIPEAGCPGQWLRLVNPVPAGPAQRLEGQLWVANMRMQRLSGP